ncbi:hypothetical protein EJM73_00455 [Clostridium botulinum]|uniref:hypothetical protein n=1 Tax=Clostridium botulinum TaxID=1491 RepID=UPI000A42AB3F|nr:hypothetical protein [Clostridium botulinum]MCC5416205.1 hypothetical protein [Clostridium botulinum]MCC5439292.1 hypothetical protein [Clostridium botulinum]NCI19545.1 hypothetical protein [Clostridium botulinum]NCI34158.1 hypothetical protein [Clostridium botulinum]NCI71261.1 hypothetical protein [Clostridium botulinum]
MQNEKKDVNWAKIMEKFLAHKGKIVDFCRENNINVIKSSNLAFTACYWIYFTRKYF